jgi:hypothetical protein
VPLTVAQAKQILSVQVSNMLASAGLDATPPSDLYLTPMTSSLWALGYYPQSVDPVTGLRTLTDADMAEVQPYQEPQFIEVGLYYGLMVALDNFTRVDTQGTNYATRLSQIRFGMQVELNRMASEIRRKYGVGLSAPSSGAVSLGFIASGGVSL